MSGQYQDYPEVCTTKQMAELIGTCDTTLRAWTKLGACDMGEIKRGVHYYMVGDNRNYIKDRMCELFGILPKTVIKEAANQ